MPSGVASPVSYQLDADGSVMVGDGIRGDAGVALRWTLAGVEALPNVADTVTAAAYAVSDDGSVIGGRSEVATMVA